MTKRSYRKIFQILQKYPYSYNAHASSVVSNFVIGSTRHRISGVNIGPGLNTTNDNCTTAHAPLIKRIQSRNPSSNQNQFVAEGRTLEVHSPDGVHALRLRAPDAASAARWHRALAAGVRRAQRAAMAHARTALAPLIGDLRRMGWLARRHPDSQVGVVIIVL